jgi:hypothetical protein
MAADTAANRTAKPNAFPERTAETVPLDDREDACEGRK